MEMKLKIMTRLGGTSFTHHLRGNDAKTLEVEIKEIVRWFIDSVPPDIRGRTDTRILVEHHDGQKVFQFTMDYYDSQEDVEQEMNRFKESFAGLWQVQFQ